MLTKFARKIHQHCFEVILSASHARSEKEQLNAIMEISLVKEHILHRQEGCSVPSAWADGRNR